MRPSLPRATRTPPAAVTALVVAVLVVGLVGVAVLAYAYARSRPPGSPEEAARRWGEASVANRADDARALACAPGIDLNLRFAALQARTTEVTTGTAVAVGPDRWRVPIAVGPTGMDSDYDVRVVRRDGAYLVCGGP